jgi:hypothetical protein
MISKPNLSVNTLKICERLSDKSDKTFYQTVNQSRTRELDELSSREYICNLIKKSSSASKRSKKDQKTNSHSSVREIVNKNNKASNLNVQPSRNIITTNIYKTTQEITPITLRNTSSSFIGKSYLNQNKRMNELKYIKDYLSNFEENSDLVNDGYVRQFNTSNKYNSNSEIIAGYRT